MGSRGFHFSLSSQSLNHMATITIRTKAQGYNTFVRILIEHPMETGRRQDESTGQPMPAHFIKDLNIELNGKPIVKGLLSTAVSRNPYFSFRLNTAKPGDRIRMLPGGTTWERVIARKPWLAIEKRSYRFRGMSIGQINKECATPPPDAQRQHSQH